MALLPYLPTSWDLVSVENFDDPTVRCVGCYFGAPWYTTFISDDEWYLGYQAEAEPSVDGGTMQKYRDRIEEIKVGDVLAMSHRNGSGGGNTIRGIGVVLYYRDLPVMDNGVPTDKVYRVFKMAWTNKTVNLQLAASGPMDRRGSISKGYRLSELESVIIPSMADRAAADSFRAFIKEVNKTRSRFLRLNLDIQPRQY